MTIVRYDLTGFSNLRDGGAVPCEGGHVRALRLLRSDQPTSLDHQDVEFLRGLPLTKVIDLRDNEEIMREPSPFHDYGFDVAYRPIFSGSAASMISQLPTLATMYDVMIDHGGEAIAQAITAAAEGVTTGSVIVHCTAGKDRTGVTIALIQELLGVPRSDIAAGYALTQGNLEGAWAKNKTEQLARVLDASIVEQLRPLMVGSPPQQIAATLTRIDTEYGGAREYLAYHGMPTDVVPALRAALVTS